jgi:hypothetical protein
MAWHSPFVTLILRKKIREKFATAIYNDDCSNFSQATVFYLVNLV